MKEFTYPQGSHEWFKARAGIPTASEFDALVSPTWQIRKGHGPETYMARKLAETIMGGPLLSGGSFSTENGTLLEREAIPFLELTRNIDIRRVGFCTTDDGKIGCSPDGLIGDDCGVEIKSPELPQHIAYLMAGVVPPDYLCQVHGGMLVTGMPRWLFASYSRQLPPLIITVERDEAIQSVLREALGLFLAKFDVQLAKLKKLKSAASTG